jgi:hypothetical protein
MKKKLITPGLDLTIAINQKQSRPPIENFAKNFEIKIGYANDHNYLEFGIKADKNIDYKLIGIYPVRFFNRFEVVESKDFKYHKDAKSYWIDAMGFLVTESIYVINDPPKKIMHLVYEYKNSKEHTQILGIVDHKNPFSKLCLEQFEKFDVAEYLGIDSNLDINIVRIYYGHTRFSSNCQTGIRYNWCGCAHH